MALCVARAKEQLGAEPDSITVEVSKNIYKNAMGVGIPGTDMNGLPIAIALGATIGRSEYELEVLRDTTPEAVAYAKAYMQRVPPQISIDHDAPDMVYVHAVVGRGVATAEATIQGSHTGCAEEPVPISNLREVYDFAVSVPLKDVGFLMDGAKMNMAAAEKSFMGNYGHGLGRLLHTVSNQHLTNSPHTQISNIFGDTLFTKILCYTCGACDARMSGALVPVMSNSGSGNQGIS